MFQHHCKYTGLPALPCPGGSDVSYDHGGLNRCICTFLPGRCSCLPRVLGPEAADSNGSQIGESLVFVSSEAPVKRLSGCLKGKMRRKKEKKAAHSISALE
jgi:hypothetical protein